MLQCTLTSKIELDLAHEDYDLATSFDNVRNFRMVPILIDITYVLPDYSISRNFILSNFEGSFSASFMLEITQ
jgi:hypothetical protein